MVGCYLVNPILPNAVKKPQPSSSESAERPEADPPASLAGSPDPTLLRLSELGRLAGLIAHDFNNLLGGILGQASLALKDLPPGHPAVPKLKSIETAARRASGLSAQVLAFAGDRKPEAEDLDINQLVEEMAVLFEAAISRKATLTFDESPGLPAIHAVPTRLRQVLLNLITNAADAVEPGKGEIKVSTRLVKLGRSELSKMFASNGCPPGSFVALEVADNGCGIEPQDIRRIFEPSFTTKEHGYGFGLTTILEVVQQHGGALDVASRLGGPTIFRVYFPAGAAPLAVQDPVTQAPGNYSGTGTILIADDEETILLVAQQAIQAAGFDTLIARDGDEAVELFKANADKVVAALLDISMPKMNGLQALAEMRKLKPGLPVLLSSGFSRQEAQKHYELEKEDYFLQKPYMPQKLIAAIQGCLEA